MRSRQRNVAAVPGGSVPVIEAVHLTSGYGDLLAVRDVSLSVGAGEVVSLLGHNGAGKTTLMLALAGELPAIRGEIRWMGTRMQDPPYRRAQHGLGFVPEGRSIVSSLSAADNLRLGNGGVDKAVAIFPELRGLLSRPAGLLSGGEQQMLTMARTLAAAPTALLVDELSLGLAPVVVLRLLSAIREAADQAGVAVLLVEQQVKRAFDICDRWFVLRRGELVASGSQSSGLAAVEKAYNADDSSHGRPAVPTKRSRR
jgi:branched-chain amino acid transport system ATP-binding protein